MVQRDMPIKGSGQWPWLIEDQYSLGSVANTHISTRRSRLSCLPKAGTAFFTLHEALPAWLLFRRIW
ncbi:MAG TPA: hypothetical protein VFU32_01745 [Ktedonobacterales bacterium]|nr:hypothetical protein [Ktedonobacterales bacterium]